jgi:hypothetical protein
MAAASVVTAAGVARVTYWTYQEHTSQSALNGTDSHYPLRLGGATAGTLGFLLATAGFWIASSARPTEPESEPGEVSVLGEGNIPSGIGGGGSK